MDDGHSIVGKVDHTRKIRRRRIIALVIISLALVAAYVVMWIYDRGSFNRIKIVFIVVLLGGILLIYLMQRGPEAAVREVRWITPWALLGAFVVPIPLVGDARATMTFFEISAQVIPILVLALAFQGRLINGLSRRNLFETYSFGVFLLLIVGEGIALNAVFRGTPGDASLVVGAISAGFVGIALRAVGDHY